MISNTSRFALVAAIASASSVGALAPLVIRQNGCPQGPVQETATLTNPMNGATMVVRQEFPATCLTNGAVSAAIGSGAANVPTDVALPAPIFSGSGVPLPPVTSGSAILPLSPVASNPIMPASSAVIPSIITPGASLPISSAVTPTTTQSGASVITSAPDSSGTTISMESSLVGITTTDAFGHTVIVPSSILSTYRSSTSSGSTGSISTSSLPSASSTGSVFNGAIGSNLTMRGWSGLAAALAVVAVSSNFF